MSWVVIVGKDWKTRALLRAQLLEEGLDVDAYENVGAALESLETSPALPGLFIADIASSDHPSEDFEKLAPWTPQVPAWIIADRTMIMEKGLAGRGFEMILFRPLDLSELVEQIKKRLEAP